MWTTKLKLVLAQTSIITVFHKISFVFLCRYASPLKSKWSEESDSPECGLYANVSLNQKLKKISHSLQILIMSPLTLTLRKTQIIFDAINAFYAVKCNDSIATVMISADGCCRISFAKTGAFLPRSSVRAE